MIISPFHSFFLAHSIDNTSPYHNKWKLKAMVVQKSDLKNVDKFTWIWQFIIQNEAYTSKTCSWCGKIQKIGGSEVYNCQNCGTVMDRMRMALVGSFSGLCLMEP